MSQSQPQEEAKTDQIETSTPIEETWQLSQEEWRDDRVLQMVKACRTWNEGNEVTVKTIVPFIYNLMEVAYEVLANREGEERKRILLAVLLHSLATKPDWESEEEKRDVLMVVRKAGAVILNFGNVNIKEKVLGMIEDAREFIDECSTACGCIPSSKKTK